jgi:hypothetical protein
MGHWEKQSDKALSHGAIVTNKTTHDSLENGSGGQSDRICSLTCG